MNSTLSSFSAATTAIIAVSFFLNSMTVDNRKMQLSQAFCWLCTSYYCSQHYVHFSIASHNCFSNAFVRCDISLGKNVYIAIKLPYLKAVYLFDSISFTVCQSVRLMILPNYASV